MNLLAFLRTFGAAWPCTLVPTFLFLVRLTSNRKLELSDSPIVVAWELCYCIPFICWRRLCLWNGVWSWFFLLEFALLYSPRIRCALSFSMGYQKSLACRNLESMNISNPNGKLPSMQIWQCPTKCQLENTGSNDSSRAFSWISSTWICKNLVAWLDRWNRTPFQYSCWARVSTFCIVDAIVEFQAELDIPTAVFAREYWVWSLIHKTPVIRH